MTISKTLAALALVTLLGLPACGGEDPAPTPDASEAAPGTMAPPEGMDGEMMALMVEAQEIQQRLMPVQQEAMQDEALAAQLDDIQLRVETAMRDENPELLEEMERLEADFAAAQESGDQERVQAIVTEAQAFEADLQALQESVLARPDIREPIDDFEAAQRARMIEIDPEAGELMDRLDEIMVALQMP